MKKSDILKKSLFLAVSCICVMIVISIMIKYDVEGEKTLPYSINKILLVSTVDGERVEDTENIWNINVTQVNDVYMYINKTNEEDTTIKSISIENFQITTQPNIGKLKVLRPTGELSNLYSLSQQDYLKENITYLGGALDDMKALEIANTGGVLGFRIAVTDLGSYVSNENTEISYDGKLLSNLGLTENEIKSEISFDIIIETNENVKYKANMNLNTPVEGVIENGSSSIEITDFSNLIFKRI